MGRFLPLRSSWIDKTIYGEWCLKYTYDAYVHGVVERRYPTAQNIASHDVGKPNITQWHTNNRPA